MATKTWVSKTKWLLAKIAKFIGYTFLAYLIVIFVGLFPVNRDFVSPEDGVTIYMTSNAVHADIIVPAVTETIDWHREFTKTNFLGDPSGESHVAFGWGDRGFYLHTPTWNDLKISTAANALMWPSETCIHVDFTRPGDYAGAAKAVVISAQQYEALVQFIRSSFVLRDNSFQQIDDYQFSFTDAFFDAKGNYHALNTCNSWVGRAMRAAGVKVPWLSPMPKTPMMYFPDELATRE